MESRKKIVKNVKDIEKITQIMQKNGIAKIVVDGVEIQLGYSPQVVTQSDPYSDLSEDDVAEWSS